jgi:hypothetical protein
MDPATIAALIQGGTALYNGISGNRAVNKTNRQMGQIQGYGREAYNPFISQGAAANQQLTPQYQQMAMNPFQQYNEALSQYQPSAGYQYKQNQLQNAAHNTAAAGGYLGTQGDVDQRNQALSGLLGEDMQQFLANIFGIKGAGMQGLEGQAGRGFQASQGLADYIGSAAGQQGLFGLVGQGINQGNRNEMASGLSSLVGLFGGGKSQIPGTTTTSQPGTQFKQLSSRIPSYNMAQSPMAAGSGLFGGG